MCMYLLKYDVFFLKYYNYVFLFQEVDEPLQLDMSGLSLKDDFANHDSGKH